MKTETLLAEIRTEELPPAQLWRLADSFADSLLAELQKIGFADDESRRIKNQMGGNRKLATPRRLTALLHNIKSESPAKEIFRRGPQLVACRDSEGLPTKALSGFMRSVGVTCEKDLIETEDNGKTYIAWKGNAPGQKLADNLPTIVERVLLNLPAPRLMRWGDNDFKFIRPIRGILMIHGEQIINGKVMGVVAGNTTKGHPFLSLAEEIIINDADSYEKIMHEQGEVIVNMDERLSMIRGEILDMLNKLIPPEDNAFLADEPETVDDNRGPDFDRHKVPKRSPILRDVAAMCEMPCMYQRIIDDNFMDLPQFCVIECMKKHQRFFPFTNGHNLLSNYFIITDNKPENSDNMLRGHDSVLRARLHDLQFYYEEDKKTSLDSYVEKLKSIVFHQKLGTQHDRIVRVCRIAAAVSEIHGWKYSSEDIYDAAQKILAPLSTLMVNEYPDLREYMARQYFKENDAFHFINLCYDLETLAGMFGVGEKPTGSKDPNGLRRNALRIVIEYHRWYDIKKSIVAAVESFDGAIDDMRDEIYEFILDRVRFVCSKNSPHSITYLRNSQILESILSQKPHDFSTLIGKIMALNKFNDIHLAAANKRINNIFRKSEINADDLPSSDYSLFTENVEHILHKTIGKLKMQTAAHIDKQDYAAALQSLAEVAAPVDDFFATVMVNTEDKTVRQNRFALLKELRALLNCVADISKLT